MQAPDNMQKIARTCVYFAQGGCTKGEKCLFEHSVDVPKVRALGDEKTRRFTPVLACRCRALYAVSGQWEAVVQATSAYSATQESLRLYPPRCASSRLLVRSILTYP